MYSQGFWKESLFLISYIENEITTADILSKETRALAFAYASLLSSKRADKRMKVCR